MGEGFGEVETGAGFVDDVVEKGLREVLLRKVEDRDEILDDEDDFTTVTVTVVMD